MREILRSPEMDEPNKQPELEQLADWLLRYELSRSERRKRMPLLEHMPEVFIDNRPESMFERRHEVKDDPKPVSVTAHMEPKQISPTPIATVLKSHPSNSHLASQASAQGSFVSQLVGHLTAQPQYIQAISRGFIGGLVLLLLLLLIKLI